MDIFDRLKERQYAAELMAAFDITPDEYALLADTASWLLKQQNTYSLLPNKSPGPSLTALLKRGFLVIYWGETMHLTQLGANALGLGHVHVPRKPAEPSKDNPLARIIAPRV